MIRFWAGEKEWKMRSGRNRKDRQPIYPHYKMSERTHHFGKPSDNRCANDDLFGKRPDNEMATSVPYQTIDCMILMAH